MFIHGGYWQRNDKELFAFVADGPRPHGFDVAVVGYTLAPDVRLTDIVAEMHQALTFLAEHADEFGFDRERLFVGGWSAGGHLTAMAAQHPAFRGGLPISGIYDLEPIALNYLNDKLKLDEAEIATLSPRHVLPARMPPLRMFVGGAELPELKRQSTAYADAARGRGLPVRPHGLARAPSFLDSRRTAPARGRDRARAGGDERSGRQAASVARSPGERSDIRVVTAWRATRMIAVAHAGHALPLTP